jgi:hypothetical protein
MEEIQKVSRFSKAGRAMLKPPTAREKAAIKQAAKRPTAPPQDDYDVDVPQRRMARQDLREPTREATRVPGRSRIEVRGRDGEVLSRRRESGIDPFHIDPSIIPDGWEYQWNAISVTGNQDVLADQNLLMAENGWRPVPSDRHAGRYMPAGHRGAIIRGGQRLEERPKALSDEARNEDLRAANQLVSDRNEALQLTAMKSRLPDGFEMSRKYRGAGGDVRISIDKGDDIPRPQHDIEK